MHPNSWLTLVAGYIDGASDSPSDGCLTAGRELIHAFHFIGLSA
jgi:hypothetical protein